VLTVSHKLGVLPVVDKILLMRNGQVELFGPRDQVLAKIMPQQPQVAGGKRVVTTSDPRAGAAA
jgi:ATP-binding cassette, subfamily C, bacterial exporter for protease/lipase